jgi:isopentenyl-diphosphate delta-isomerase
MEEVKVILVDENDNEIGLMHKTEAHEKGILHRAVSVFLINSSGDWLLQRRALHKYHSAGLWTNTCCSHPLPEESNTDAANRRLKEEMGLQCALIELFSFTYFENFENGLTEHELDHVFLGVCNQLPEINTDEVIEYKYSDYNSVKNEILQNHENYTIWFRKIHEEVYRHITDRKNG